MKNLSFDHRFHLTPLVVEAAAAPATAAQRVLESVAIIDVSRAGAVGLFTAKAKVLLQRYFPEQDARRLPQVIVEWLRREAAAKEQTSSPCNVPRADKQLVVRLVGTNGDRCQLLLEETSGRTLSAEQLERLGLTRRQAEVLLWISHGKTSPEIAIILGCRTGTVSKHTEHIFGKLGVETRTAAAAIAIEAVSMTARGALRDN